jgi:UTP--glucose-1-phosphate uridylyltransferase
MNDTIVRSIGKVRKAVIPAAGLGTRMLPISRAVPKEVLPIVDKPAIAYLVEEAARSGITDVLIITGRGKGAIEDYFDYSPEYEAAFRRKGREEQISLIREDAAPAGVRVFFMRQRETRGLGHAIGCARSFVGDEPFAVLYGDDIIMSQTPVTAQLISQYEKHGKCVCGVKGVPTELVMKYCSLKARAIFGNEGDVGCEYFVDDIIEKPKSEAEIYSNLAILGRVILTPDIFDRIDNLAPGAGGEIQLTDAIAEKAREDGIVALDFEGERFDLGSKLGFLMANVTAAATHPETGEAFLAFLREFMKDR